MTPDPETLYATVLALDARKIAARMGGKMGALPEFHGGQAKTAEENAAVVLTSIRAGCHTRARIHARQKLTAEAVDRALALLMVEGRVVSHRTGGGRFHYQAVTP